MLIDKDMSKAELREKTKIAPSTFHKMSNNEYVSLDVLVRICSVMKCGLDDIVEMEDRAVYGLLAMEVLVWRDQKIPE